MAVADQPLLAAFSGGIADVHVALVIDHVAADHEVVDRGNVQRGGVLRVGAALLDDADFLALQGEGVLRVGLRAHDVGRQAARVLRLELIPEFGLGGRQ